MATESKTRSCPYCKETIHADAVKCKHCGSRLAPAGPTHGGTCPYCKEEIHPDATKCKHCKSVLTDEAGFAMAGPPAFEGDFLLTPGGHGAPESFPGELRSTLPKCRWVSRVCGSSLPGYPPILCWDYVCRYGSVDTVVISRLQAFRNW